ncbi:dTDP-4-dehydrorhamnose 3,5-epimerase [Qipengyuania sp. DSG2-2]|uniref:dTDP-4-dehydrorhamnose 3,5-epimerase n=1 Tax=Qipengyuania sp. DGS2-2 TaxID=3349631 RepID=UPI0036D3A5EF
MQVEQTALPGCLILTPRRFADDRGWFSEVYSKRALAEAGITCDFVQDNHSLSREAGTVRGLHYQSPPHAQAKLVRVAAGAVRDVAVDFRQGSPTYGEHIVVELSAENGRQLFIPAGFLHGFVALEADTQLLYKCSDFYAPECDGTIRFDDPDLAIDWGIAREDAVLSAKDAAAPSLAETGTPFQYEN